MGKLFDGRMLTFHNFKGVNYLRSWAMRGHGISHGYDYFIPESNGSYRYFNTYMKLKEYIDALVEVENAKKKLAKLGA